MAKIPKAPSLKQIFNVEPIPGFSFKLFFYQNNASLGELHSFEVNGLELGLDLDSGDGKPNNLVKGLNYKELVVKKAVMNYANKLEKQFYTFMEKCIKDTTTPPFQLLLIALNNIGAPIRSWVFFNAFPIKFSTTGFDAQKSGILFDEITFQYESFKIIE